MKVLAVIPARSGSKSVPHKNIRPICGKPMLAYSIEHAVKSKYINRIIVSTDSEEYAAVARQYGAEVPFLRPAEYATDTALDYDVFRHCLLYLKEMEGYFPDVVVQLRPTYPVRNPADIDAMIELLLKDETADSVRSMTLAQQIPYKMWKKGQNGEIKPLLTEIPEGYNMPRQELPKVYYQNACIDVFRPLVVTKKGSMTGDKILGYEMQDNFDVDTEEEFIKAQEYLALASGMKRFVIDIDGVVAGIRPDLDYAQAEPVQPVIDAINKLYARGHYIVMFTARGYVTKKDWSKITKEQLDRWGLHYHELLFGKPNADYYVDDHMLDMHYLLKLADKL